MAYSDDLLQQAFHLLRKEPRRPKQASLRRAISAAYYALFHLLVEDAVRNWRPREGRAILARCIEHRQIREASRRLANQSRLSALRVVADAMIRLYHARQIADYDLSRNWSRDEALLHLNLTAEAFASWTTVRDSAPAQEYLVSMLAKRRD